jgi:LCP family protein required for cell wall assembly
MFRAHGGSAIVGKAGYTLGCVLAALVLVASGFAYYVKAQVGSIGGSNVISGGPSAGAMNILLMGLESRTYWSGKPLPRGLEDIMHIGSTGGNATNTLILIHIFAGGQKAVGFSVPRDDWVNMVGTNGYGGTQGKIDQAYGFALASKENQLQGAKLSQGQLAFQGNEAGRLAAIKTVQALTGVHIDQFAELNLDGFYQLAQVFGGIEVCLNKPAYDPGYSGANIPAGYHHLDAAQALSFVRQRENLTNGDLDRTHRQQAVLDYVIWKLKHQGVLTDLSQLSSLLTVAQQYLITDASWNLPDFLTEMKSLSGTNLTFKTLPIHGYATYTVGGQLEDVNIVDPTGIKEIVHNAFYPPATSQKPTAKKSTGTSSKKSSPSLVSSATTVDVYNGGGTPRLATQLSQALTSAGYKAGQVGNITARSSTQVLYGTGAAASAAKIAGYFNGVTATASSSVAAGHVEVLLGTDATSVPTTIVSSSASASSPSASSSLTPPASGSAPTASQSNGASGGAVTVKANAPYGIPCVN